MESLSLAPRCDESETLGWSSNQRAEFKKKERKIRTKKNKLVGKTFSSENYLNRAQANTTSTS